MGTKRKTYDYDIPTIFFHCVGGGSCIALLLGYFLLDKNVNTGMKFFLYWTCASILAFTAGFYLRTISGISGWGFFSIIFASSEIFAGLVIQGLAMTYLFVTYQPGPDQISQIYAFSWILVIAVIHALWTLEDGTDQGVVWNPFYEAIGKSLGIDSGNLSILMFKLSVFTTIGLWATIAALIGNGGGNVMDANLHFFLQWTGMSILALIPGILLSVIISHSNQTPKINEVAIRITHIINYFLRSPFFAGVILQSLAMTYFFANMHQPNLDQMMQIRILSWILFAVAISVIFCITTSDFSSSGSRNPPHKFTRLAAQISTLSTIGLWATIAVLIGSQ